jgi:hypothetical protein
MVRLRGIDPQAAIEPALLVDTIQRETHATTLSSEHIRELYRRLDVHFGCDLVITTFVDYAASRKWLVECAKESMLSSQTASEFLHSAAVKLMDELFYPTIGSPFVHLLFGDDTLQRGAPPTSTDLVRHAQSCESKHNRRQSNRDSLGGTHRLLSEGFASGRHRMQDPPRVRACGIQAVDTLKDGRMLQCICRSTHDDLV